MENKPAEYKQHTKQALAALSQPVSVSIAEDRRRIIAPKQKVSLAPDEGYLVIPKDASHENRLYLTSGNYDRFLRLNYRDLPSRTHIFFFEDEKGQIKDEKISAVSILPYEILLETIIEDQGNPVAAPALRSLVEPVRLYEDLQEILRHIKKNKAA